MSWGRRWSLLILAVALAATFALAGLRAALWAGALGGARANLVVLVVGVLLVALGVIRARGRSG